MVLHTKNDRKQHCYMLKYWPNKGLVMIRALKDAKRSLEDPSSGQHRPEAKKAYSWEGPDYKGEGKKFTRGGAWTGDSRASPSKSVSSGWQDWGQDQGNVQKPKQGATYDSQGRLQPLWS
eukprot:4231767-Heterocapsa_arctica.AAC.1